MDNNKMIGLSNETSLGLATTATAMIYQPSIYIDCSVLNFALLPFKMIQKG